MYPVQWTYANPPQSSKSLANSVDNKNNTTINKTVESNGQVIVGNSTVQHAMSSNPPASAAAASEVTTTAFKTNSSESREKHEKEKVVKIEGES